MYSILYQILNLFKSVKDVLFATYQAVWEALQRNVRLMALLVSACWAVISFFAQIVHSASELLEYADENIIMPVFPELGNINIGILQFINTFVPLDLAVSLFAGWFQFWIICFTIRMIKAWIPTLN